MTLSTLITLLLVISPLQSDPPPGPEAGYIIRGEYSNSLLGFSFSAPGKWKLAQSMPAQAAAPEPLLDGSRASKPQRIDVELTSKKASVWISAGRRDISRDLSPQVEEAFATMRQRIGARTAGATTSGQYRDRQLYAQELVTAPGEDAQTGRMFSFESAGYLVTLAVVTLPKEQKSGLRIARSLSFQSESADSRADLLLRAVHREGSGFSYGSTQKTTELFRDGTLEYECRFTPWFSKNRAPRTCGHSVLKLSAAELATVVDLLHSEAVARLADEYGGEGFGTDYWGSMSLLIPRAHGGQWVNLPSLSFSGETNNKLYPPAIRALVCKVFGLRQRAGDIYGKTTSQRIGEGPRDDTWCTESDLRL